MRSLLSPRLASRTISSASAAVAAMTTAPRLSHCRPGRLRRHVTVKSCMAGHIGFPRAMEERVFGRCGDCADASHVGRRQPDHCLLGGCRQPLGLCLRRRPFIDLLQSIAHECSRSVSNRRFVTRNASTPCS